jgi:shikimate dehydrogenase
MSTAPEPIHTLADLEQWSFAGTALAVIGRPIAHSLSPAMHNAALAQLTKTQPRFCDWHYFKFDIAPETLPWALTLFHQKKFYGLNLTVPHKALVIDQLESSDDFVRAAGAANTLTATPTGWRGANTDGFGLAAALQQDLRVTLTGAPIILLGAGGAARAAAAESLRQGCASLWIGNRTSATLGKLLTELVRPDQLIPVRGFDLAAPPATLPAGAVVINATSLGLAPSDPAPINLHKIPRPAAVFDMIYRPPQTALLRQAAELGLAHTNGLAMLVHQGARALELWTQGAVPTTTMQAALSAAQ